LPSQPLVYCYAERENQVIFGPDGNVYKCSVCDFTRGERFGFLHESGTITREADKWNDWFHIPLFETQCESCVYLPLCMGGCRKARVEGKQTGSFCRLVPTNASYTLKNVAFGNFEGHLSECCAGELILKDFSKTQEVVYESDSKTQE
jgi:radical SAM protein with 4Fe4S-binding SPASM domain